eukprot:COSAG02_NODE_4207_length_5627_cov_5.695731_2_plen_39_part_00
MPEHVLAYAAAADLRLRQPDNVQMKHVCVIVDMSEATV